MCCVIAALKRGRVRGTLRELNASKKPLTPTLSPQARGEGDHASRARGRHSRVCRASCARPRVNLSQPWFVDGRAPYVVRFNGMPDHSCVRFLEVRQIFSPITRSVFPHATVYNYSVLIRTQCTVFFTASNYRSCFNHTYRSSLGDRSTGVCRKRPSV
jgi:hypothetical protein